MRAHTRVHRVHSAVPFVLAALVAGFGACSHRSGVETVGDVPAVEECAEYEAAFKACAAKLGTAADDLTDKHVRTMRVGFASTPRDERSREELKRTCMAGALRMTEACR